MFEVVLIWFFWEEEGWVRLFLYVFFRYFSEENVVFGIGRLVRELEFNSFIECWRLGWCSKEIIGYLRVGENR